MIKKSEKLLLVVWLSSFLFLLPSATMADTRWKTGKISTAPWQNQYWHIGIDGRDYIFMPKAVLQRRVKKKSGLFQEKPLPLQRLREKQKVFIKIQGSRIYQLILQQ